MAEDCFFSFTEMCAGKGGQMTTCKAQRIEKIISCSRIYGDGADKELQQKLDADRSFTTKAHSLNCVSSQTKVERFKKRQLEQETSTEAEPGPS